METTATAEAYAKSNYVPALQNSVPDFATPSTFQARSADMETEEAAQAYAAQFPKSTKPHITRCSGGGEAETWSVNWNVQLSQNGVNGGVNETGIKRMLKVLEVMGSSAQWQWTHKNSYSSLEDLLAAI